MVRMDGRWVPTRGTPTVLGVPRAPKGESRGDGVSGEWHPAGVLIVLS